MKRDSQIRPTAAFFVLACLVFTFAGPGRAFSQEIEDCLACHQDHTLTKQDDSGRVRSLYVEREAYLNSVHGGYACVDCHEGAEAKKHPADGLKDVQCSDCHEEAAEKYAASNHGTLLKAGNPLAPNCYDCHTMHAVLPADDAASTVNRDNLYKTCGACHEEQAKQFLCGLLLDFVKGEESADALTLTAMVSPLATRLKGHGKVDLGCRYSTRDCANCHIDAIDHGAEETVRPVCIKCHAGPKAGLVFGRLHRANTVMNPFLSVLLALGYIAGLAGLVFYFKAGRASRAGGDGGGSPAAG